MSSKTIYNLKKYKRISNEEFISRSINIHGDKFDYSLAVYINNRTPVKLICKLHNIEFLQNPESLWNGACGCPKCLSEKMSSVVKLTQDEVIASFIVTHGDRYDYSKVVYKSNLDYVEIGCKLHGTFLQKPSYHKSGSGCPICRQIQSGITNRTSIDEFLQKANSTHNSRYTYDLCNFETMHSEINILCPHHGAFKSKAFRHIAGASCPECEVDKKNKIIFSEFLEKAKEVHGDRFDYSESVYVNNITPIDIICKDHGKFSQLTNNHLKSMHPCPFCRKINKPLPSNTLTQEEIIKRFKEVHGDRYNYSKVKYKSIHSNVTITCKKHGDFDQNPSNHLQPNHCPKCQGRITNPSTAWLDSLNNKNLIREYRLPENKYMAVDGYDPTTNTVYQFHGMYWHSDSRVHDDLKIHGHRKITHLENYTQSQIKDMQVQCWGYNLVIMKEYDWNIIQKDK